MSDQNPDKDGILQKAWTTIFWGHWNEIQEKVILKARWGQDSRVRHYVHDHASGPSSESSSPHVMTSCCHHVPLQALGLHCLLGEHLECLAFCLSILVLVCHVGLAEGFF